MTGTTAPLPLPEDGVVGRLPFDGSWLTEISPTRQVPSHGTDLFGTTYAIDFIAVDEAGRTAPGYSLRTIFATEPSAAPCTRPWRGRWRPSTTASPITRPVEPR